MAYSSPSFPQEVYILKYRLRPLNDETALFIRHFIRPSLTADVRLHYEERLVLRNAHLIGRELTEKNNRHEM